MKIEDDSRIQRRSRWCLPAVGYFVKRAGRRQINPLASRAVKEWEIAPGCTTVAPRAVFLPGQLDRVTNWAFANEHPRRAMDGGEGFHAATRGFLLKDVWMLDGALFKDDGFLRLTSRRDSLPRLRTTVEIDRAALFCTTMGNRYFGQWLMDDCVTYPLACAEGVPVMTDQPMNAHTPAYEEWLDMKPARMHDAYFRELVMFEDYGQNRHKHARFRALGEKLLSHVEERPHPGVFIVRGRTGELRMLRNEIELAERLRDRRGFRIVDPSNLEVPEIIRACAGARVVVGIEGSGLMHGILVLREGCSILTLQPPNRFVTVYKHLADRDGQNFGFVVGMPDGDGFWIDPEEVERTLDLFPT
jgi:hypothetical protein